MDAASPCMMSGVTAPPVHRIRGSTRQRKSIEDDVRNTVLPDNDDGEEHPWEWLVELLDAHGVDASTDELKWVPYRVEFSPRLYDKLRHG
jgi:hypothetical protein